MLSAAVFQELCGSVLYICTSDPVLVSQVNFVADVSLCLDFFFGFFFWFILYMNIQLF